MHQFFFQIRCKHLFCCYCSVQYKRVLTDDTFKIEILRRCGFQFHLIPLSLPLHPIINNCNNFSKFSSNLSFSSRTHRKRSTNEWCIWNYDIDAGSYFTSSLAFLLHPVVKVIIFFANSVQTKILQFNMIQTKYYRLTVLKWQYRIHADSHFIIPILLLIKICSICLKKNCGIACHVGLLKCRGRWPKMIPLREKLL